MGWPDLTVAEFPAENFKEKMVMPNKVQDVLKEPDHHRVSSRLAEGLDSFQI